MPIPDQQPEAVGPLGAPDHEVARLLGHPLPRRVPRCPENLDPTRADLEDEEDVDPPQQHRVYGEEVTRQHCPRLRDRTRASSDPYAAAPGKTCPPQYVPDRRRSHAMAKADKFAMDTAMAPRRILPADPHHHFPDHPGDAWATSCRRRLRPEGPVPGNQLWIDGNFLRHGVPIHNLDDVPTMRRLSTFAGDYRRLKQGLSTLDFRAGHELADRSRPLYEFWKPEKGRYLHPTEDRALTHFEAARIQGFSDDHCWVGSKSAIGRQIGNAVPIPLGRAIATHLAAQRG